MKDAVDGNEHIFTLRCHRGNKGTGTETGVSPIGDFCPRHGQSVPTLGALGIDSIASRDAGTGVLGANTAIP